MIKRSLPRNHVTLDDQQPLAGVGNYSWHNHLPSHIRPLPFLQPSTMRLLAAAAALLATSVSAHSIQLPPHGRECFHENLHREDRMTVSYQVGDREFGSAGNLEIDFWVSCSSSRPPTQPNPTPTDRVRKDPRSIRRSPRHQKVGVGRELGIRGEARRAVHLLLLERALECGV